MSVSKDVKYPYPCSQTGGVKPLSIKGIFITEAARLSEEFTDEDRKWRKQWLKDQELSPTEPRYVPELETELRNPIRRFFSKPWSLLQETLTPVVGKGTASNIRFWMPKVIVTVLATYGAYYNLKYNGNDWTRAYGWNITTSKPTIYPGDKNFPSKREKFHPWDYNDRGFKDRKVFRDI